MLWIKKVEMVDSLEELKSSRSVSGKNCPNFEMLDAKIVCALNKIIQNSQFKKQVSLKEQKAQNRLLHLWASLERKNPADVSTDGNWIFSQSPTMSPRRGHLRAIGMGKLTHIRNTSSPIIKERDASKRIVKEFTIASRKIQHFVTRNSELIELKKYASRWTSWRRKSSLIACRPKSI